MNGFGGDAEAARFNLAAARDVVDGDKMNGRGLTEAGLRLQDRENNLRVREEALDRLERQMQQQLQEEEVSRQDNLRKRSEVLSRLEKQLQQIREDAVKYREEAQVDRKKLSDKMTQLESLERSMKIREEALRTRQEEAQRKKKHQCQHRQLLVEAFWSRSLGWLRILSPGFWLMQVVREIKMLALHHRYSAIES